MEGVHFVAGPWFMVLRSSTDWNEFARIVVSDGATHEPARLEMRLTLEGSPHR